MTRMDTTKKPLVKETNEPKAKTIDDSINTKKIAELEHQLIETERKSLGLFELTNDAIFLIDLDGKYIDVNQRAAELLGYNRHDIIGMSLLKFVVKDEQNDSKQRLEDLKAGHILPIYRRTFRKKDGSIFIADVNAAVVQDEEGKPAYIQSAVRDITEKVKAELALERERTAYHNIAEAIIYTDSLQDFCVKCLPGLTELLGFESSTIRVYNSNTKLLIPIAQYDFHSKENNADIIPESIDNPHQIFALAARSKRAVISSRFEDRAILAPFKEKLNRMNIRSLINWPLVNAKEEILGVLELVSKKYKEIDDKDIIFFETIARMFTVAFERKSAEEALIESEEKYRSFAQNFLGIAYRKKLNLEPVFYNGSVNEITGYLPIELLFSHNSWLEIILKEDRNKYEENFQNLISNQCITIDLEYRIKSKNGPIKWVHDIGQIICDEENNPIWIQGAIYDITDKKRIEEIQAILRRLGIALAAISDLSEALKCVLNEILELDILDSGCIFVVEKETGFLNLVSSKGLSKNYLDRIAQFSAISPFTHSILSGKSVYVDFTEIETEIVNDFLKEEGIHSLANIPIISEDKIAAIINLASHTIANIPNSTRNALEAIASQLSGSISRISAEQAFRDTDERYRNFVQNFQGIAYRTNDEMMPIFFHGAVEEMTGYTGNDLLRRNPSWSDLVHPYDSHIHQDAVGNLKDRKQTVGEIEYRIITKSGEIRWVNDSWQIIYDKDKFIGIQGSIYNISDRKEAQTEIQSLYQDLEKRVDERTEQLTSINKELTAFSYSVSHDLRTPLRHIAGFANLLQKKVESMTEKDERIVSYTQKIIDSTEEMNKLIDGLLTFSRMSRVEMVKIRINLTELVQDVLNDFQIELGNRQIDVSVNFLPDVIGDPSLLRLVLVNLISNAFKFTKNKEVTKIDIGNIPSKDQEKTTIYIRDNGEGFDMKYYERLFGVFQRLHKSEDFEGTGIGLATVQRVIRRMGGDIWAEGAVNNGATFYFSVPKAEDD